MIPLDHTALEFSWDDNLVVLAYERIGFVASTKGLKGEAGGFLSGFVKRLVTPLISVEKFEVDSKDIGG